jgi:hypothetical protein
MASVIIGVDPHKLSATIEVVDEKETVLAKGRFDRRQLVHRPEPVCVLGRDRTPGRVVA